MVIIELTKEELWELHNAIDERVSWLQAVYMAGAGANREAAGISLPFAEKARRKVHDANKGARV